MLYAERAKLAGQHIHYCEVMRLPAPTEKQVIAMLHWLTGPAGYTLMPPPTPAAGTNTGPGAPVVAQRHNPAGAP